MVPVHCFSITFMVGSSMIWVAWTMVGSRMILDVWTMVGSKMNNCRKRDEIGAY